MDKIKSIALNNGQFAVGLIEKMSKNTDEIILQKLMLSMKNMRGRIAYILLFFAEKINHSYSYEIPLRRKEIAQLIDLTPENVIRTLSEFSKENIIKLEGKKITLKDIKKLKKICELG
jgi:CRP/FNR family transcriptional regulator